MNYFFLMYILIALISFSLNGMQQETEAQAGSYKKNLQLQQQLVKRSLKRVIDSFSHQESLVPQVNLNLTQSQQWLLAPIQKAIVADQMNILRHRALGKNELTILCAGYDNSCVVDICEKLAITKPLIRKTWETAPLGSVDAIIAPYTLYSEMEALFKASEDLLSTDNPLPLENHPLFNYFDKLDKDGIFLVTLHSGPNVQDFTYLLLNKHELALTKVDQALPPKLKIFNSIETFLRCLDIFKKYYAQKTGKVIICDLSFSLPHVPLDIFCNEYVKHYPELIHMNDEQLERFVRLLSVFAVGNDIVDLIITVKMAVKETDNHPQPSFRPIPGTISLLKSESATSQSKSNEISLGQQNLDKQIQNLEGSELSMIHIKDADGAAQLEALKSVIGRPNMNIIDLGGGRGETNALMKALQDSDIKIHLLNIEPHKPFKQLYLDAQHAVGITDVDVWEQTAQQLSALEVIKHFKDKKVDVLYASHSFYFLLGDMYKASLEYATGSSVTSLAQHPLWKYFDMLHEKGVFLLTMQSGAGARLFRNALLGNHGLNRPAQNVADETVPLLSSFGNMATLLRHFELFAERYQKETGKVIAIKMHYSVANVPLGSFTIGRDPESGGYILSSSDKDSQSLASKMLDFYGNWSELQMLATLTPEKVAIMDLEIQKKLGLENATYEAIIAKRENARKMQEIFLHILRAFAPARKNMQHPNITLEIRVQPQQEK